MHSRKSTADVLVTPAGRGPISHKAAPTAGGIFCRRRRRRVLVAQYSSRSFCTNSECPDHRRAAGRRELRPFLLKIKGDGAGRATIGYIRERHLVAGAVGPDISDLRRSGPGLRRPGRCEVQTREALVREYNAAMSALAIRWPTKIKMLKTEDLSDLPAQRALYNFVGAHGAFKTVRLNIGTTKDGRRFRDHHLIETRRAHGPAINPPRRGHPEEPNAHTPGASLA